MAGRMSAKATPRSETPGEPAETRLAALPKAELLDLAQDELGLPAAQLASLTRKELVDLLRRGRERLRRRDKATTQRDDPPAAPRKPLKGPDGRPLPATVDELPPSPLKLDDRLVLLCRDPSSLFCYWTLDEERLAEARREVGADAAFSLRLEDLDAPGLAALFPCQEWARSWYLPVLQPRRRVRAVLGLSGAGGRWLPLLGSNEVQTPALEPSEWREARYADTAHPEGARAETSPPVTPLGVVSHTAREISAELGPGPLQGAPTLVDASPAARQASPLGPHIGPAVEIPAAVTPSPAPAEVEDPARPGATSEAPLRRPFEGLSHGPGPLAAEGHDVDRPGRGGATPWLEVEDPRLASLLEGGQGTERGYFNPGIRVTSTARGYLGASEQHLSASEQHLGASEQHLGASERWLGGSGVGSLVFHGDDAHLGAPADAEAGRLALVLHAHLPFVRHPEHDVFYEEEWLYEAITETYIPLLSLCERLRAEGLRYHLTLALSPTLLAMLGDELLRSRYVRHLRRLRELAEGEARRVAGDAAASAVVEHYRRRLADTEACWWDHDGDLAAGFADLARSGELDLLTCAATHGYLPLLGADSLEAVRAQLRVAVREHSRILGRAPQGIWLPECAFTPGLDSALAEVGLRYFVADGHAVAHAHPRPTHGGYAPVISPDSGVAVFPRDGSASEQVWSREVGYPGDPVYRDFYRDIGWDLPEGALAPLRSKGEARRFTGLKYHRITGPGDDKLLYDPVLAEARARDHARHFVAARCAQLAARLAADDAPALPRPLVVAPYDAELFGHWWYEGPLFIEHVLRGCAEDGAPKTTHLGTYLDENPYQQLAQIGPSSWGQGGYHGTWLNDDTAWIYPLLSRAAATMTDLARRFTAPSGFEARALKQAGRELLLAQGSDWAFLIRNGTARSYAEGRTRSHLERFDRLAAMLEHGAIDVEVLSELEAKDNLFANLDYRIWR